MSDRERTKRLFCWSAIRYVSVVCLLLCIAVQCSGWPLSTGASGAASVKTRSTYYTPEKVAAARQNIERYAWARNIRDRTVAQADKYAALGYRQLWESVPSQSVPRGYIVNKTVGSPVSGREIDKFGAFPYTHDPLNDPWKITDPSSGYRFPTNDFAAYYRSGINENGQFDPKLADRSLLVNELYPDKGRTWGVDDGYGWIDERGNKFTFVAYYTHWAQWKNLIFNAIISLRDAYIYTGDTKYAHAGIVLLDRIADIYPSLDISEFEWEDGFENSHGYTMQGKIVGSILEADLVREFVSSYDAFFPAMVDDKADYVAFLNGQAQKYKLKPKATADAIKANIEDGLVRQVYPAVRKAQIHGNFGLHQSALAMAAVVLDEPGTSEEWIRFLYQQGSLSESEGRWSVSGGNIADALADLIDRDGFGNEAAPNYNEVWLNQMFKIADILHGYPRNPYRDLYDHPKFRKMMTAFVHLIMNGRYTVQIGDSGATGKPEIILDKSIVLQGFRHLRDPLLAQTAYFLNGNRSANLHYGIYTENPEQLAAEVEAAVRQHGPLQLSSELLSGYGLAVLRDGDTMESDGQGGFRLGQHQRDAWLYFGRTSYGHAHYDALNLGLHAYGLDLAPDLGYVSYADSNPLRTYWESNTVSHNTVVVDESAQKRSWVGLPKYFDDAEYVKLMDVEAPHAYPQTDMYRRTVAMIKVDESRSYIVDIFRVRGGERHHFSFHGAEGEVTTEGLSLRTQRRGTYAGESVGYGDADYNERSSSGFNYLTDVRRDSSPPNRFSVDWKIRDTWKVLPQPADIHLRLTMLGSLDEVALAGGNPPQNKPGNPSGLTYMVASRSGSSLSSVFTSVLEPYVSERFIQSVDSVPVQAGGKPVADEEARAVKITLVNGRVDYVVSALNERKLYTVDGKLHFRGAYGVYAESGGRQLFAYVHDGTHMGPAGAPALAETGAIEGEIIDFTKNIREHNAIRVELNSPLGDETGSLLNGRVLFVDNGYERMEPQEARNASYTIREVEHTDDLEKSLNIGDVTLIRSIRDAVNFNGYAWDIRAGQSFRIPLSAERVAKLFRDVPADHWGAQAVYALADRQIVDGISESDFAPQREVTRAEFAALVVRALKLEPASEAPLFADVPESGWFARSASAAASAKIVDGVGDSRFDPHAPIKREQMAAMLVRAYEHERGRSRTAEPDATAAEFTDTGQISRWAQDYVSAARRYGLLSGRDDGVFAPQGTATRAEAAQAIYNLLESLGQV